jgi:transposase InsO family protein
LPSQARDLAAVDFPLLPTLTYRLLCAFVIFRHDRRDLVPINVTDQPTAVWTPQQIIAAFPDESASTLLLRDRDAMYGEEFARRVKRMGIREVLAAPRAPWQNPFVERVISSIRPEGLDHYHFLILNAAHLRRLLRRYLGYDSTARPHLSLDHNSPQPRVVEPPPHGHIVAIPQVGGLHHRYQRVAYLARQTHPSHAVPLFFP